MPTTIMTIKRRNFLLFLGISAGTTVLSTSAKKFLPFSQSSVAATPGTSASLNFQPIKIPIPLEVNNLSSEQQKSLYNTYEVVDEIVLPEGFTYDVIAAWGDKVGDSRFGYNNDYLSLIETASNEGLLTINFEYISGKTWIQTFDKVIGKSLPFNEVKTAIASTDGTIDAFSLPDSNPLKAQIKAICQESLIDLGMGVISLRRNDKNQWERTNSQVDRRITGISGLNDGRYLSATGPAVTVFEKARKIGYDDGLGSKIIGTFQNCAGGTTPWGTVFSAEENYQDQVPEPVMADGSSLPPAERPFVLTDKSLEGQGNVFALAGNKYGWMVEIDPSNPNDYGTKHTWLGRYRHEAVAFRAVEGKRLAVYSGCDRRGGHLYKFVSESKIKNLQNKANSRLLEEGMLYGAVFSADGTGIWVPLNPSTPINPVLPSQVVGSLVPLPNPNRSEGGIKPYTSDAEIVAFQQQFKTLSDLYTGNSQEKQGVILIDAHYAANAAGITCTARPEDTEIAADGTLYVTFTSGTPDQEDGGPDQRIFRGPNGETPYEFGWIMRLKEDKNDPASMTFHWDLFATGGEPTEGGLGFANPDNLEFDRAGNLWMVTDMSTSSHNKPLSNRIKEGKPVSQKEILGVFGSNTAWFMPTSGSEAGNAYPFAIGPIEVEMTGPWFTRDQQTLFFSIQHPGEEGGIRQNMAEEMREFALKTTTGEDFIQKRTVPKGSNWPGKQPNDPPRPTVVAIRRINNEQIP